MFQNFRQAIFTNYPEEYKDEFMIKIEHANYMRSKYFSYVIVLVSLFMFLISIYSDDIEEVSIANLLFLVSSVICAVLFNVNLKNDVNYNRLKRINIYFEIFIVIAWSSSLIVLIPQRFELVATYSVVVSSTAALLFLRWQVTLVYCSLSCIYIIVFGAGNFLEPKAQKISTLISLVIVAWLISRLLYKKEIENFATEKEIQKKSLHEEKIKNTLNENYSQLIEANSRIKNKTEQLAKANELLTVSERKAQMANSIKTDFLARMSHDMRTPLTALIGLSDFGIEEQRDDKDVEYFRKMKDSSEYLLSLVNDTLDLQKLESSNIDLNYTVEECSSAAKKVMTIIEHEADVRGVRLIVNAESTKCKEYIKIDEKRVEQILINILSNALKYTPKGGVVTWDNAIIRISDDELVVRGIITDNGVGMSQEFTSHMYEPFSKEYNSLSNRESSTGLGLAISKNLIEIMGGNIECESELGKGTKFTIDIPHKYASKKEIDDFLNGKEKPLHAQYTDIKKVLICEDSNINAQILSKMLKQIGIISEYAKNGQEGVDMAKVNEYDAILMDIRMPIMDGLTAAFKIREFDKETPIIALSANAYDEDIEKSIEAGMNAHLAKPFNKEEIFKELGKHF